MIRFGIHLPQEDLSYDETRRFFKKMDCLDFDSAFIYDHFHPLWSTEDTQILECWTLLPVLAVLTNRIKIGVFVNCNSYRPPSILAKMAAGVDMMSGGRLEFMIGAGGQESSHKGYGLPFPSTRNRIEMMKEAIQIIRKMWTEHRVCFNGRYYHLDGAICYPKPLQKPYPKIWVGGGGERYTLRVVAELGEGSNFFGTPEEFRRKLDLLKKYCHEIGRDYSKIEKSWAGAMVIGENEQQIAKRMKKLIAKLYARGILKEGENVDFEKIERSRLIGTPSEIINKIEEYLKLGVNYFIIIPRDHRDHQMIKMFNDKIIPAFQQ